VFAKCPRQYFLERYIGWNWGRVGAAASTSDTPAAELGTEVHNLLAEKPGAYSIEAHQLAAVFQKSELGLAAQASPRVFREWDFILDIDGTLVRGVIDLWFERNGEIHIVDYKTDSQADPAPYVPQLQLYALALERAFGRGASHAWLHFLRFDRLVEIPIDHSAVHDLIGRLKSAQDHQAFDLNEGPHCRSCAFYRGLCPAK
jgi:ATP-dependent exoDNAse (exonuclease V) beta subunit